MKRTMHGALALLLICTALSAEAEQRRSPRDRRDTHTSTLRSGNKAPAFELHPLSDTGETGTNTVTLADATRERPAAIIFSSFT